MLYCCFHFFFFKQKTAYEMRISDWSSDVCSSDLPSTACRRRCRPQNAPPPLRHSSRRPGLLLQSSWPKSPWSPRRFLSVHSLRLRRRRQKVEKLRPAKDRQCARLLIRSEERRVGKECVSTCSFRG